MKKLTKLAYLWLNSTPITDAGLSELHGLTQLVGLDLRGTKATAKGASDFHTALPGCKIEYDGGVIEAKK